jgi:hypothetical protein
VKILGRRLCADGELVEEASGDDDPLNLVRAFV